MTAKFHREIRPAVNGTIEPQRRRTYIYRPELYDLKILESESGLNLTPSEIVAEMALQGWIICESTLSRLRTGSGVNIDVAGLPFYATGQRLLSRAAVSEITEKLWAEYEDFCKRDLSEHAVAYLFINGIAERLRPGQRREAVLAAWGIGEDGRKALLGLMAGSKEDVETVRAFFQDLRARGLGDPLLVVSDGAPGSSGRSRNASPLVAPALSGASEAQPPAKVSADPWPEFKARVTACYQAPLARDRPTNWRPAPAPITPTSCPVRSPVSRTISRPASRTPEF